MIHTRRYVNKAKYAPKITDSLKPLTVEIPNPVLTYNSDSVMKAEIKQDFEWALQFAKEVE